ncbi:AraC family transcriptional regulator [Cohnella yongneupensis]|uniref:AraC family transcriptional regulator n=1 Tax=Cohnella yongneupensis TaxID=425006 RepID=A0ABW0R019_9BACL
MKQLEQKPAVRAYSNYDIGYVAGGYKPPNRHEWGPGVRDVYALHYIVSGKGVLETRKRVFHLSEGESFLIFPNTEVYYYPDSRDPWAYVWNEFKGEEARRWIAMTLLEPDRPTVTGIVHPLQPLYQSSGNPGAKLCDQIRSDAQLRLLLSYYMEYYPNEKTTAPTDYVGAAIKYIEHHYWKSALKSADIANAVNIERSYLYRLFKQATGMSVSVYLLAYRIERACELLKTVGWSVKSIAYSVGFNDPLYFSKVFKRATSYTPSAYMALLAESDRTSLARTTRQS